LVLQSENKRSGVFLYLEYRGSVLCKRLASGDIPQLISYEAEHRFYEIILASLLDFDKSWTMLLDRSSLWQRGHCCFVWHPTPPTLYPVALDSHWWRNSAINPFAQQMSNWDYFESKSGTYLWGLYFAAFLVLLPQRYDVELITQPSLPGWMGGGLAILSRMQLEWRWCLARRGTRFGLMIGSWA
jgi:hypothetical protein